VQQHTANGLAKESIMGVKFTELIPAPRSVPVGDGKSFEVRALGIEQLATFLTLYREPMTLAFNIARNQGDWVELIMMFPKMVRDLIATATDTTEEAEVAAIAKLPLGVQVTALSTIWEASVPEPKKFHEILDRLNAMTREAVKSVPAETSNVATLAPVKEAS
jgi:hypothetical protein